MSLLKLLQLCSPTLPIGAYAYSQSLEQAVHEQWINDQQSALDWIQGVLEHSIIKLDVPIMKRLFQSWDNQQLEKVEYWSQYLSANRESQEMQTEDRQLGMAMARLLVQLDITQAQYWLRHKDSSYATLFSLAIMHWEIDLSSAVEGYCWAWCENQVAAAIKLVPLGQTSGQQILFELGKRIPDLVQRGLLLTDEQIGSFLPGVAIASAHHEQLYSRLFRS
jgi:urease accessory protein